MNQTPRYLRAMLSAHERNRVRRHPMEAIVYALYMLSKEDRQRIMNAWAVIARDEAAPEDDAGVRGVTRVVKEEDVADWLRQHGQSTSVGDP